jgi:hypothetical protein
LQDVCKISILHEAMSKGATATIREQPGES